LHGSPRRINEYLLRDRGERTYWLLAESESDDVLAFGHAHDAWFRRAILTSDDRHRRSRPNAGRAAPVAWLR
jgi:alpha-beta hydrolase superfamily lysophospholipase